MATETYQFWEMVLNAPATIAAASGLAVALITLVVTFINNWYTTKAKKLEWERAEARRKEERYFELKRKAYEKFILCFTDFIGEPSIILKAHVDAAIKYARLYGSDEVRRAALEIIDYFVFVEQNKEQQDLFIVHNKSKKLSSMLKEKMHKDLASHFNHTK